MVTAQGELSVEQKALTVNLEPSIYGTFAEIGAGQEVARNFFSVGGAAGTVAKTISAYDMKFSDAIYGKADRYVSRTRLNLMLLHEFQLLQERLGSVRGQETKFFVFADTVAARSFKNASESHGWMGVRFQTAPGREPNDIILHVRMLDDQNIKQQQALGILGTNLIYGAFYLSKNPDLFIRTLVQDLEGHRVEVDMVEFLGPDFADVDNRVLTLKLVQYELTNAVLFGPNRTVLHPADVLYKKPILLERGSFRPVTKLNVEMLESATALFRDDPSIGAKDVVTLLEITLRNLLHEGELDLKDFLARTDTLTELGYPVLLTNYPEFFRLPAFLRRYTKEPIGVALGLSTFCRVFEEQYYDTLDGGILEAMGRLFHSGVKLYLYPMTKKSFERYQEGDREALVHYDSELPVLGPHDIRFPTRLQLLYKYLWEADFLEEITNIDARSLRMLNVDALRMIQSGDPQWEELVPEKAAALIKRCGYFGYSTPALSAPTVHATPAQS